MSSEVPWQDARTILTAYATGAGVQIEWPNEGFAQPTGADMSPACWLSVESIGRTLEPVDVGGDIWQEQGTLFVHINAPLNTGTDTARALAKTIANLFRGLGPRNVIYLSASIGNGAPNDQDGMWWVLTVAIDWKYQDISPIGP